MELTRTPGWLTSNTSSDLHKLPGLHLSSKLLSAKTGLAKGTDPDTRSLLYSKFSSKHYKSNTSSGIYQQAIFSCIQYSDSSLQHVPTIVRQMADQVATAVVGEIVKKLIEQISRQFSYLFSYTSNIKSLEDGVKDLKDTKDGVEKMVEAGRRNLEEVGEAGKTWLDKVEEKDKMAQEILEGTKMVNDGCMKGWCPNLKQRYSLSRKAVKQIVDVKELINKGNTFTEEQLFDPKLPSGMVASSSTTGLEVFESRISMTNQVIDALKNEIISSVGICGLGGIGKTRMATEIRERAVPENFFDEVAMAEVSQNPDLRKIQDRLASMLDLELKEKESVRERGKQLRERLTQDRRILVILDDLWDELDLGELGIPVRSQGEANGCKLLITSRDDRVCIKMGTQIFSVQLLSEEEAWALFKQKAGDSVETSEFRSVAEKVLNECGHLPLAIITVGAALKGCQKYEWEDALHQLERSRVTTIEGMDTKVYASLRLSYDYLARRESSTKEKEGNQHQQLFLLCCIFPEDDNIPVELLVRFSVGLGFLNDVEDLESARNRVRSLVDQLKSCHLLEHSEKEGCVKIHDVVRDFGLIEASNGEHVHTVRHDAKLKQWPQSDGKNPTAISIISGENLELPPGLDYPSLRLLLISAHGSIDVSIDNFRGMKELRVLVIYGKSVIFDSGTMAKAAGLLMNVRTLCLERCRFSTDIGLIGSLCNLEILSFRSTKEIDVLPKEIGQLTKLKLLDLRDCEVGLVESGVLSSLTKLEELYMGRYFSQKGVEELNNGNCARVTELSLLSCLRRLQLRVSEPGLIMMLKDFPGEKLTRFHFSVSRVFLERYYDFANELNLDSVDLGKLSGSKFEGLMRRAEVVSLSWVSGWKNIMRESDIDGYLNLKKLVIKENDDLVEICDGNVPVGSMGKLEELRLSSLSAMMYIWRGRVRPPCLNNLKVFVIEKCNAIQSLFSPSVVRCLLQLEVLEISDCELLVEIISEDDENANIITLPNLKHVKLQRLPRLGSQSGSIFSKVLLPSMETLTLGYTGEAVKVLNHEKIYSCLNLQKLKVIDCKEMEVLFDLEGVEDIPDGQVGEKVMVLAQLDTIYIFSLFNLRYIWKNVPKQGFQGFHNLTKLDVVGCNKLRYLMSISMAKLLVNLQVINVRRCELMEYVIMTEEEKESPQPQPQCEIERTDKIVFPNLLEVNFWELNNLKAFCQGSCHLEFPSLKKVDISGCNMKKILRSESPTPNFEVLLPSMETLILSSIGGAVKVLNHEQIMYSCFNLQRLVVNNCNEMEVLFDLEGVEEIPDGQVGEKVMVLAQLDTIYIDYLFNLRYIWKNVPKQGFQGFHNLTKLYVDRCPNLRYLMSPCMAKLLVNLQVIKVENCGEMEYVIMTEEEKESSQPQCEIERTDKIVFPNLFELNLENVNKLKAFSQGSCHLEFPSLKKVYISRCNMKKILRSESPTPNFEVLLPRMETLILESMYGIAMNHEQIMYSCLNLQKLYLWNCNEMEVLFDLEGVEEIPDGQVGEKVMVLAQLHSLKIEHLNELREIWKNVPKQGFQGFHNLTVLDVSKCPKLRYLVSPCMAKLLVSLQVIKIMNCMEMEEVIQRDDDEKEKSSCGTQIVFPCLREIHLTSLSSLKAFHEGRCNFVFPLLDKLVICKCINMNKFCSSSVIISQPKLQCVKFENSSVPLMGDLNTTIQNMLKRQGESSEPKMSQIHEEE